MGCRLILGVRVDRRSYYAPALPECTKTRVGVALLTGRREEGAPCTIGFAALAAGGTRFCNDQKKMMIMPIVRAVISAASKMPIERELMCGYPGMMLAPARLCLTELGWLL